MEVRGKLPRDLRLNAQGGRKTTSLFVPPYRVGRKQGRAVLDSKGKEVVVFSKGLEDLAVEYCNFKNKEKESKMKKTLRVFGVMSLLLASAFILIWCIVMELMVEIVVGIRDVFKKGK